MGDYVNQSRNHPFILIKKASNTKIRENPRYLRYPRSYPA